jgi:hypothetical protein
MEKLGFEFEGRVIPNRKNVIYKRFPSQVREMLIRLLSPSLSIFLKERIEGEKFPLHLEALVKFN